MSVDYQKLIFNTDDGILLEHMKKHNVSQKMLDDSLDQLESWFELQPHFPNIDKNNPRYKRILAINGYSIEKSKKKIENLFTARTMMPDYFSNRDMQDPEIRKYIGAIDIVIMPKLTPENYRIVILKLTSNNIELFDPIIFYKFNFMVADFRLSYDTVFEDIYISDFSMATVQHAIKITPSIMKAVTHLSQECYNTKVKAFHIVNVPSYVNGIIGVVKSMIKKKVADRIQIHSEMESLHKFIPKEYLPAEFGGTAGVSKDIQDNLYKALDSAEWKKKLNDYSNEKSDESKRIEGTKNNFEGINMEGSFRRLDLD